MEVNSNHKKMLKHSAAEFDYNGSRTGIRGGRMTSLAAKSFCATKCYLNSVDELKYMVNTLY